jgi:hypothetical protein
MIIEVIKKAMTATTLRGSSTRNEKVGGAMYAKHKAAIMEAKIDEKKFPKRDTSTTTIIKRRATVARLK